MTPADMAHVHAAAFAPARGWSASEIAALRDDPFVTIHERPGAFAMVRTIGDETELLTLATAPAKQRRGYARALLQEWLWHSDADRAFLEVAADNHGARHLYEAFGFVEFGRRRAYYARAQGDRSDAVLMQKALAPRSQPKSVAPATKTG